MKTPLLFVAAMFLIGTSIGQDVEHRAKPNTHDLSALGKTFDNYAKDFRAMEKLEQAAGV